MAITKQIQTPLRYATVRKEIIIPYNSSFAVSGTFNGVTCGAATTGVLYDRWFFRAYSSSGSPTSQRNASQWPFILPDDYIAGSDLEIDFIFTSTNTSGTMNWGVGLCKPTAGGLLGDEADTTYQTYAEAAGGTTTFDSELATAKTYSGTGLNPGDPCSIVIYRDDTVDGMSDDCYIQEVHVRYESQSYIADDSVEKFQMTPTEHRSAVKNFMIPLVQMTNDAGTFNSVICSASALSQDQYRIMGWRGDQTTDEVIQMTMRLPSDYIAGTNIDVDVAFYGEGSTAGDIVLGCGLCSDIMGNTFGDESDTTYDQDTITFNGTRDVVQEHTFNFTVSTLNPGDPICFIVYRAGGEVADTYDSDINITGVTFKYESNWHGDNI